MSENKVQSYLFGDYQLHVENCQLLKDDIPVSLTQKSFEVLLYLVENRGRILKKEELLDNLWEGNYVEEANLTQHIYMLRKALKQNGGKDKYIETIPKNGYRFVALVDEQFATNNVQFSNFREENEKGEQFPASKQSYTTIKSGEFKHLTDEHFRPNLSFQDRFQKKGIYFAIGGLVILLGILVGVLIYFNQTSSNKTEANADLRSVAVLPFKQIDKEKDEKLGVGIADVLIARLANIEDVTVRPTTSIIRFAEKDNSNLFDIGKKLDVNFVIAGTIQKQENLVRITTQLFSVRDKKPVWTEKFDEEYSDIFTLQDKISERIAQKFLVNFNKNQSSLPYKQFTKSVEAYQAYSMGLSYWSMHSKDGFEKAIGQFEKAIEKDPEFVNAYAYLADTYGHSGHIREVLDPKIARRKGLEAAKKALELDNNNAEALAALALIYANENKQKEAFELMQKAVQLKPNGGHIRHRISWMYANRGNIEKAVDEMRIAQSLDPQSSYLNIFYAEILLLARKPDEAIKYFNKGLEIEPGSETGHWRLIEAFEQKGEFDKAEEQLQVLIRKHGNHDSYLLVLSRLYAENKKETKARAILDEIKNKYKNNELDELIAYTEIALGENEKALKRIKPILVSVSDNFYRVKFDHKFDPIRKNPEFQNLLAAKEKSQGW